MTKDELSAYYRHLDNIVILRDNINTERAEGRVEGREEGRAEGREEGLKEASLNNARNLKHLGVAVEIIAQATGLSQEEIASL